MVTEEEIAELERLQAELGGVIVTVSSLRWPDAVRLHNALPSLLHSARRALALEKQIAEARAELETARHEMVIGNATIPNVAAAALDRAVALLSGSEVE